MIERDYASFLTLLRQDLNDTLRSRWFLIYVISFMGLLGLFFAFGLAESSIIGFTGLGRLLLAYIQISLIIIPIFVLITTARTLVGEKEAGVWEYILSFPVSLSGFYWGKLFGRFVAMVIPIVASLWISSIYEVIRGGDVPWVIVSYYSLIVTTLIFCFLGIGMLISVASKSQEMAVGLAFGLWLMVEALIDALLLGVMIKRQLPADAVLWLAYLNPLQGFRTAAIALFDPELTILGPLSYTILDTAGCRGLLAWAVIWPVIIGAIAALIGAHIFTRRDVI